MNRLLNIRNNVVFICIFILIPGFAAANRLRTENELKTLQSVTKQSQESTSDSLPSGVTKDWLKSLKDINGNRIIPGNIDPESDALQQKTFNSTTSGELYAISVASAGDVNGDGFDDVIIGAPLNGSAGNFAGQAYIYFGGVNMNTTADVILTGETANSIFGYSVSGAGDVNGDGYSDVIVGAYGYSGSKGRAYIFYGGSAMNNAADVIMDGEAPADNFGYSVSQAGDVNGDGFSDVFVSAYGHNSNTGRAYIYYGGAAMNNIADVTMNGEAGNDYFGFSVSQTGDVNGDGYSDVICGAYGHNSNTGRAYIYFGGTAMNNIADVIMNGETVNNNFGYSVSGAGDVNGDGYADVIAGANGYNTSTGRVYVLYGGAVMNNIADVTMTGEAPNDNFGASVSKAGDINGDGYSDVIVGAPGNNSGTGKVYIYNGGAIMNNAADISLYGESVNSSYGASVSQAGDVNGDGYADVIAGAYQYNNYSGRAYIYTNTLTGEDISDLSMTGETTNNWFGCSVSSAGDVNGDGYADVIVGAYRYNSFMGRAYIFYGGATMNNIPDVTLTGEASNNYFGQSVSKAGDVNGDGYADVIVGAFGIEKAYIYYGGAAMNNIADVVMTGETAGDDFGISVSAAGDVNGDGYSDVIAGANAYNSHTGRAYIYYGGAVMNNVADVIMTGENVTNDFGVSVSGVGDVNGDGYSDVVVGADLANSYAGKSYLYYGGAPMNNTVDVIFSGEASGDFFGASVSGADVNGDGYSDIIVGAEGYNSNTGRVYIYYGGSFADNIADVILTGESSGISFGRSVSGTADVNGDGYSDIIVSAEFYGTDIGRAYIYFGGAIMNNTADITMTSDIANISFGISVADAGDLNGDGISDLIVGAFEYNTNQGKAYIYLSSPPTPIISLNLITFVQGFYNPVSNSQARDTLNVYLRSTISPYSIADSAKNVMTIYGRMLVRFKHAPAGTYYIVVKHRNSIETWSKPGGELLTGDINNYDMSNSVSKAFGNNIKQIDFAPVRFGIYGGDVNQDGHVDLADIVKVYNDANNFVTGYKVTDVTGDKITDLNDLILTYNNSIGFVSVIRP